MTAGKNILLGLLVVFVAILGYFVLKGKVSIPLYPSTSSRTLTVNLNELGGSGEKGTAKITETSGKVMVTLDLSGAPQGVSQPAHIHKGACPGVGEILYSLSFPKDGKSETTLNLSLDNFLKDLPLAVNVHKSASEAKVYFSCGDIKP